MFMGCAECMERMTIGVDGVDSSHFASNHEGDREMKRRRVLDVIIRTWEEARKEVDGLTADKYVVGHISYAKRAICLGTDYAKNLTYQNKIENLVRTIIHETVHWALWYREDQFIEERKENNYERAASHLFDNISGEMDL